MTIKDLKDLGKLIDLCRKKGVESITVDGIALTLGDQPEVQSSRQPVEQPNYNLPPEAYMPITPTVTMAIASEELTDEQLLFYSTGTEE